MPYIFGRGRGGAEGETLISQSRIYEYHGGGGGGKDVQTPPLAVCQYVLL